MFEIRRYTKADAKVWNSYVATAKNATFLFDRGYMEYHEDRFTDFSLLFYIKGKLYALLPAHVINHTLYSHFGLTYGGLIMDRKVTAASTVTLFEELNTYLRSADIHQVVYRPAPSIYHQLPAEEDLYAIWRVCHAQVVARDISSTIILDRQLTWRQGRKEGINRCNHHNILIERSENYAAFWEILTDNLSQKYHAQPVHSLEEILWLKKQFPENIQLFVARKDECILGGTVLYITPQVVHTQYISASLEGKKFGVIDAIFHQILHVEYTHYRYFDFGKSTEQGGLELNKSLIFQKEGFGGRGICYDTYEWSL